MSPAARGPLAFSVEDERFVLRLPPRELDGGSCAGHPDPGIFFGTESPQASKLTRQARLICVTCPVQGACRTYALDADEPHGVWGGLDSRDRAHLLGVRVPRATRVGTPGRRLIRRDLPCDSRGCGGAQDYEHPVLTSTGARFCQSCRRRRGFSS